MIDSARRIAAALAAVLLFVLAARAGALEVGEQVPAIELPGFSLPSAPGKLVYVDFWASWCGTCRKSFPWMNAMQQKYAADVFEVVGINLDAEAGDAAKFLARVPVQFHIAYDASGASARAFGVKGMPTSVLIGPDGKVLYRAAGFGDAERAEVERLVAQAAGARP